jgi:predicted dehydrogenase
VVDYAIVGAGVRGAGYAEWIARHPGRARLVAVAEPRPHRRLACAHQFPSWQALAAAPRLADAVIVSTQDSKHVEPVVALARKGYHVLVEKPLAPTPEECTRLVDAVTEAGVLFAVGHVMRYRPYTRLVKRLVDGGRLGEIVSVQHLEPVGFWHQAHSYVRGNWRRRDLSSCMLLSKSCHDIDWLRHIVGQPIERVSSFGSLRHFRRSEQPAGAADRCLDCAIEATCPYSARRFYLGMIREGRTGWPVSVLTADLTEAGVTRALREGPYGRCVYACDNDVVDHQVVAMEFAGGATGTFTMTAFTPQEDRQTRIFGTRGCLEGNGTSVRLHEFLSGTTEVIDIPAGGLDAEAGHAGGDDGLMDAFTTAVATGEASHILSGPAESLESHLAVFAAERARLSGTVEEVSRTTPRRQSPTVPTHRAPRD